MLDYIFMIAFLLLTSSNPPMEFATTDNFPSLRWAVASTALELEVLDPRELGYVFFREEEFKKDIEMVRRRIEEIGDAPPLNDCYRFPDRPIVNEMLGFNRAFKKYLEERLILEQVREAELRVVMKETDKLYQIWDAVLDARSEYYYVTVRRKALKRLQELIGERNYFYGRLPPHVPLWRFEAIP